MGTHNSMLHSVISNQHSEEVGDHRDYGKELTNNLVKRLENLDNVVVHPKNADRSGRKKTSLVDLAFTKIISESHEKNHSHNSFGPQHTLSKSNRSIGSEKESSRFPHEDFVEERLDSEVTHQMEDAEK